MKAKEKQRKAMAKARTRTRTRATVVASRVTEKTDCRHRNENCGTCGKKGHTSQVCRSDQSTRATARAVDWDSEDAEEDPITEVYGVWAMAVCSTTEHTVHQSSEDNLSMSMGSGAEEHGHQRRLATLRRARAANCAGSSAECDK